MGRTGGGCRANCGQFRPVVIGPGLSVTKPRGVLGVNYGRCSAGGVCDREVNDPRPVTTECDTAGSGHCGRGATTCNYNHGPLFAPANLLRRVI